MKYVYKNGNTVITIDTNDGTKEMITKDDEFNLDFPSSLDIHIGSRCDGGCKFCYINASPDGIDADLMDIPFIDTLHPYTECAINGNSLQHPQLIPFLKKLKSRRLIANITVNQLHFERKEHIIRDLVDQELVKGIGISLRDATPEFIIRVKKYPNAVIHTINGILSIKDIEAMKDQGLKLLILGYKNLGRGVAYKDNNSDIVEIRQRNLYKMLPGLIPHFAVVSFDNLAIEQLNVKRILSPEQWDSFYMGDEGTSSMFVDLVSGKFGVSSLCEPSQMHPLMDNIKSMFAVVKKDATIFKKIY